MIETYRPEHFSRVEAFAGRVPNFDYVKKIIHNRLEKRLPGGCWIWREKGEIAAPFQAAGARADPEYFPPLPGSGAENYYGELLRALFGYAAGKKHALTINYPAAWRTGLRSAARKLADTGNCEFTAWRIYGKDLA